MGQSTMTRFFGFILSICVLLALTGCRNNVYELQIQGYVEAEYLYIASPYAGRLTLLSVHRGQEVNSGATLFALDTVAEQTAKDEAERRLTEGRAKLEDLKKGKRPSEISSIEAQIKQAKAALKLADMELGRQEKLFSTGAISAQDRDRARSTFDADRQRVAQLEAELSTARLGSRSDQVQAAEANVSMLEAALVRANWDLSQKQQLAPQQAIVFDTLYNEGEWVAAGKPVVVLLSPGLIKVRAFIPETLIGTIKLGDRAEVFRDGVTGSVSGRVSYISPRVEYTPPVIYSQSNRSKLVVMIEVAFEQQVARELHPGQPVDLKIISGS